jgi:hypothetical protein
LLFITVVNDPPNFVLRPSSACDSRRKLDFTLHLVHKLFMCSIQYLLLHAPQSIIADAESITEI